MKKILTLLLLLPSALYAQISFYDNWQNVETVAYRVEELQSEEIKSYNRFINSGYNEEDAMIYINAARAHTNLEYAPATIIRYGFFTEDITEKDSIPDAIGACGIAIELINSTPKTIKEITLEFEFFNGGQIYDIKTGDKYCVLKFKNLKGRTKSYQYDEIRKTILDCWHALTLKNATYKKLFYNKTAKSIGLHRAVIRYNDGTVSTKIAIFDTSNSESSLYHYGPLYPITAYLKKLPH